MKEKNVYQAKKGMRESKGEKKYDGWHIVGVSINSSLKAYTFEPHWSGSVG